MHGAITVNRLGFVGLGAMGAGMAGQLLAKGFALSVHARQPSVAQAWAGRGVPVLASPAGLARSCEAVVLCVTDAAAVREILFGPEGLVQAGGPLRYVIDCSSIGADDAREFARRLRAQGIDFLDAPVSGGPEGARQGTLACMVGGDAQAFEACRAVLAAFSRQVTRIGDSGAGQVCKSCNQVAVLSNLLGVANIVGLCRQSGIDPQRVRTVLLDSSGSSQVLRVHAQRLIDGDFAARFRAELMLKDVGLASALEQACGVEGWATSIAGPLLAQLVEAGLGGLDWTAIGRSA